MSVYCLYSRDNDISDEKVNDVVRKMDNFPLCSGESLNDKITLYSP